MAAPSLFEGDAAQSEAEQMATGVKGKVDAARLIIRSCGVIEEEEFWNSDSVTKKIFFNSDK